jgi:hypothetical protein
MRFAIFGDHPDGWRMAEAFRASGRHELIAYAGPATVAEVSGNWPNLRHTPDLEELLADPQIHAVIVASVLPLRLEHLRRVLQSERPALCVHPVDSRPDGAYEIQMLQGDVHQVALPILPDAIAPQIVEVRRRSVADSILNMEIQRPSAALFEPGQPDGRPAFPGWTLLSRVGGEIVEIAALAAREELEPGEPVVGFGKFQSGQLFRASWLSNQPEKRLLLSYTGGAPRAPIEIALNDTGLWLRIIERFEFAVEKLKTAPRVPPGSGPALDLRDGLSWNDEVRALELNDLARRSIERRRAYSLDFQEATEEVGFKGTMTLVGCALLWLIPLVLLLSAWIPWLGWTVVPVLLVFLGLQFLKGKRADETKKT